MSTQDAYIHSKSMTTVIKKDNRASNNFGRFIAARSLAFIIDLLPFYLKQFIFANIISSTVSTKATYKCALGHFFTYQNMRKNKKEETNINLLIIIKLNSNWLIVKFDTVYEANAIETQSSQDLGHLKLDLCPWVVLT